MPVALCVKRSRYKRVSTTGHPYFLKARVGYNCGGIKRAIYNPASPMPLILITFSDKPTPRPFPSHDARRGCCAKRPSLRHPFSEEPIHPICSANDRYHSVVRNTNICFKHVGYHGYIKMCIAYIILRMTTTTAIHIRWYILNNMALWPIAINSTKYRWSIHGHIKCTQQKRWNELYRL